MLVLIQSMNYSLLQKETRNRQRYSESESGEMQFNNVFVVEDVVSLGVLAVVDAGAPDSCEFQFFGQMAMNVGGQVHDG
jgi:hypothetical protein